MTEALPNPVHRIRAVRDEIDRLNSTLPAVDHNGTPLPAPTPAPADASPTAQPQAPRPDYSQGGSSSAGLLDTPERAEREGRLRDAITLTNRQIKHPVL
jgi:hypothetical protein